MHVDDHERTNKIPMDRPKKKSARRSLLGVEACRRYVAGAAVCSAPSQIHSSSSATAGATGPECPRIYVPVALLWFVPCGSVIHGTCLQRSEPGRANFYY